MYKSWNIRRFRNRLFEFVITNAPENSYYELVPHRVFLTHIESLMHEYIHSLTLAYARKELWAVEGVARYFSIYYDYYSIDFLNADANSQTDVESMRWVQEYLEKINRPIDIMTDSLELYNIAVYSRSWDDPNDSYTAGASFIGYVINCYGEETAIYYACKKDGEYASLDKTYAQLVAEWNDYIEQNYSSYSKF